MDIQTQTDTREVEEPIVRDEERASEGEEEDVGDVLDPRIQIELDRLNLSSIDINRLENELDEARSKYRSIVSQTAQKMKTLAKDRKRSIQKAREYYTLLVVAKECQGEALTAVRQYQAAISVYQAAKETVALAESNLTEQVLGSAAQITSAWQEMLNHSIEKVMTAEKEKSLKEKEHKRRAAKCAEIDGRLRIMEKANPRCIKRAKAYFDLKSEMDIKLLQQKQNVTDLQAAIKTNKNNYTEALRRLEAISEEIHQSRREKLWSKIPRMPGVGAEASSVSSGMSELCGLDEIDNICAGLANTVGSDADSTSITSDTLSIGSALSKSDSGTNFDLSSKADKYPATHSDSCDKERPSDDTDDEFSSSQSETAVGCRCDSGSSLDDTTTRSTDPGSEHRVDGVTVTEGQRTDDQKENMGSSEESETKEASIDMANVERPSISGDED